MGRGGARVNDLTDVGGGARVGSALGVAVPLLLHGREVTSGGAALTGQF